ncbi:MAG: prepilin peptidase [Planctomycetes bacterium]|nr:prepilin peptidase [Planctomycetota bacterium]
MIGWYELSDTLRATVAGIFGLFVGSFLNVAIYRLPREDVTVSNPKRSACPNCKRQIRWYENVPVVSWLALRGRCAGCRWKIPWRYPLVELLTAGLWAFAAARLAPEQWGLLGVHLLVLAGLVVATFVDFDCFEIPDEVSIGGIVLAPLVALLLPEIHADTWIARELSHGAPIGRWPALVATLAGMATGGGILWGIGWLGERLYGREAMGFGDVKLLCGAGGLLGPGGTLAALLVASLVASVVGVANIVRVLFVARSRVRRRRANRSFGRSFQTARIIGRYLPFGPYLALGIGIVLVAWNDVRAWF